MKEITIHRSTDTCSCNVCLARNYEPCRGGLRVGEYVPDLYEVRFGPVTVYLCKTCMEKLRDAINDSVKTEGGQGSAYS